LIHRDVKPANIFVCRMGLDYDFVKVLDFGLVKVHDQQSALNYTQSLVTVQQVLGTPAYMAPETILEGGKVDARADVYALGCVAYFLLTGKRVFDEGSPMQSLIDHVHTKPVPPSQRTALSVPREVDEIVLACLEKDPDNRPQDAGAVGQRIAAQDLARGWTSNRAQAWWQTNLPELSHPLTASPPQAVGV
jgi:eukaryotic-like serine/threonine-protein kinase